MNEREPGPLRKISEEEVDGAIAAFVMAHEGCGEAVEFGRLADNLVCYCASHDETVTYVVRDERRDT
jgi:hypothetical protein